MKRKLPVETSSAKKSKPNGHWAAGLLAAMNDPNLKVSEDDKVVVIKDKYPKARHHFLILPKEDIPSLKSCTKSHLKLLKHMQEVAINLTKKYKNVKFNLGYHAQASMFRLHLHVISDDMDSVCLKTKKHWNSFTTSFFLESEDVVRSIEESGEAPKIPPQKCKELMNEKLKCNKCDFVSEKMPPLKKHILTHC